MIIYILPAIFTVLTKEISGKKCLQGVRTHKDPEFDDCGLLNNEKEVECPNRSCYVTDMWFSDVKKKPLTITSCGDLDGKPIDAKFQQCKAMCNKDEFLKNMEQKQKKKLKEYLMANADKGTLTDACVKKLTKVEWITVAKLSELDKEKKYYCNKENRDNVFKKDCKSASPPPKTDGPSEDKSPTAAVATTHSNKTGNGTTSGEAKSINAIIDILCLTLAFISMLL